MVSLEVAVLLICRQTLEPLVVVVYVCALMHKNPENLTIHEKVFHVTAKFFLYTFSFIVYNS